MLVRNLEAFACACRLLEVLTEQLQLRGSTETASHPDPDPELSHHPEGEDPTTRGLEPSPTVHPYTCLMQQAAELLADMHREQQTAADALEAMIDHLATAASPQGPELWGFAQRPSFLGDMPRCTALQLCCTPLPPAAMRFMPYVQDHVKDMMYFCYQMLTRDA
jgi:hypothetical protein